MERWIGDRSQGSWRGRWEIVIQVHGEVDRRQEPRFMERQRGDSNTGSWRGGHGTGLIVYGGVTGQRGHGEADMGQDL